MAKISASDFAGACIFPKATEENRRRILVMTTAEIAAGLRSETVVARFETFCRAREFGSEAIEPAAEVVFDPNANSWSRSWAVEVIAWFVEQRPARCRELLLGALADLSPVVRACALRGLSAFRDEITVLCIESCLEDHRAIPENWDDPYTVSAAARWSLAKITEAPLKDAWVPEMEYLYDSGASI